MRILAAEPNEKGDLFGRLVVDLFLAQGYEDPQLSIHKTGREIDVKARHRVEQRRAIAECKATKDPIGGDDLNKFAGVAQAERESANGEAVQAYYISLSGFRPSALAQEEEFASPRFILLDSGDVEDQLVAGGMVVSPERACEAAGRLVADRDGISLMGSPRLLGHEIGWVWLCEYAAHHQPTHFALIHADGAALSASLAQEIVDADREVGAELEGLDYLSPSGDLAAATVDAAEQRYRDYLLAELGEITLEGLPADEEAGARRIALEALYVPLNVISSPAQRRYAEVSASGVSSEEDIEHEMVDEPIDFDELDPEDEDYEDEEDYEDDDAISVESIGGVLVDEQRIAILAAPGAGKSTLIKRLAVAYANAESREKVADDLPDVDWLPVFLRCRSLGGNSRDPILEILKQIPRRGEFPEHAEGFSELIRTSLVQGRVLLLVDGLDEISDPSDRLAFALQLRTFLSTYPNAALVLTSREAGFRTVGGAVSSMCKWYRLAKFDDADIRQLTRAWHATVVGDSKKIDEDAIGLADTIVATDRVRRLATNPLLLTTLLLVKRWVGALPRKRSILYEKAIEVLLMTWNVEAHDPIDREEAIPQLAFVAYSLTERGSQSLSATTLAELLSQAREQMPDILGYARMSVSQFVERVESRSSLLVMTGHAEENGNLVPLYEFRHLTFQEYLSAVALVEGYYADHVEGARFDECLQEHLEDPRWFEIVALANVKAGRGARAVFTRLLELAGDDEPVEVTPQWEFGEGHDLSVKLLGRGLADEVQLPPELVVEASQMVAKRGSRDRIVAEILEGRYGDAFRTVAWDCYLADHRGWATLNTLQAITAAETGHVAIDDQRGINLITERLSGPDDATAVSGALGAMQFSYEHGANGKHVGEDILAWEAMEEWARRLFGLCERKIDHISLPATWALAWIGNAGAVHDADRSRGLEVLLDVWRGAPSPFEQHVAAWAFVSMPEVDRESKPLGELTPELEEFVETQWAARDATEMRDDRKRAAAVLAYYLGGPWSNEDIAAAAQRFPPGRFDRLMGIDPDDVEAFDVELDEAE
jgi:PHD/YefM family antitoxin component YafN of YafNO toxin-antitoxin module